MNIYRVAFPIAVTAAVRSAVSLVTDQAIKTPVITGVCTDRNNRDLEGDIPAVDKTRVLSGIVVCTEPP